ncbi:MAG: hypothetical protein IPP61_19215 [Cytophagaceae bacterium]|nr:hypothetical protein [Cytophagaceae bacterium]MBL0327259.1 hypothetical protein [Cytophagaceae bacterium]
MELLGIGSRIKHENYGAGVVLNIKSDGYEVTFIDEGTRKIKFNAPFEIIESVTPDADMVSLFDVERSLTKILQNWMDATEIVPLGDRWKGGKMILEPGKTGLASKEIPVETFFHKIVMMRDKLRVLEQKVNASMISDEEKVDIQQYISRCYGSMTTFNILFKETDHQFKS